MGSDYDKLKCQIKKLKCLIIELFATLMALFPCPSKKIKSLPVTLTSGKWCLADNLTYSGSGPAITISGPVILEGNNFSLILANTSTTGISITSNNVQISNLSISQDPRVIGNNVTAISGSNISDLYFNKITISGTILMGISLTNCQDIYVNQSNFNNLAPVNIGNTMGVSLSACSNISVKNSDFNLAYNLTSYTNQDTYGLFVTNNFQNLEVDSCNFYNDNCISLEGNGARISNSQLTTSPYSGAAAIQAGGLGGSPANNVHLNNLTITVGPKGESTGVWLVSGDNATIDNCNIYVGNSSGSQSTGIDVGFENNSYNNILVRGSVITGANDVAVNIVSGTIRVLESQIKSALVAIVVTLGRATVNNSQITSQGIGINTTSKSGNNSIANNIISSPVAVEIDGNYNVVSNNIFYSNTPPIVDNGTGNIKTGNVPQIPV